MSSKKLYRSCQNRILGGICGGLGEYFDVDPILIRLIFIILLIAGGASFIFYIIAWIIIPNDPKCGTVNAKEEIKQTAHEVANTVKKEVEARRNDGPTIVGIIILILGTLILIRNITGVQFWSNLWPVIFIVLGLYIIFKKGD